jgi:hypothetical protein
MSTARASKCHHIRIPPEACVLVFSDDQMFYTERLGFSARGDEMWAHCDAAGRILEIELLGDDKPCQRDDGIRQALRRADAEQLVKNATSIARISAEAKEQRAPLVTTPACWSALSDESLTSPFLRHHKPASGLQETEGDRHDG